MLATLYATIHFFKAKGLTALIILSQLQMSRELSTLIRNDDIDRHLPVFKFQRRLWFGTAFLKYTLPTVLEAYPEVYDATIQGMISLFPSSSNFINNFNLLHALPLITFTLFSLSLIIFISSISNIPNLSPPLIKYVLSQASTTLAFLSFILPLSTTIISTSTSTTLSNGLNYSLFAAALVAINDTMAYLFGTFLGRTKLLPTLSPNKTFEGYLGALLSTTLIGYYAGKHLNLSLINTFAISSFVSIVAPYSGFMASAVKRAYNVKDFGTIIPGHGGVVDRLDCQLLVGGFVGVWLNYVEGKK
jgi:phosphatidate cytidylyltransferase